MGDACPSFRGRIRRLEVLFPRKLLVATSVVLMTLFVLLPAQPATAGTQFNGMINGLRASKGLHALQEDGKLNAVAQDWANQMAARGAISHRSSLSSAIGGGWAKLGENVGTGGSAGAIFSALVNSPGHYRNMVDSSFTHVGTGVARGADGRIYTAHNFGSKAGSSAPRASRAAPASRPAPAKAAPATSAPRASSAGAAPRAAKAVAATPPPAVAGISSAPAPAPGPLAAEPAAPVDTTPAGMTFGLNEVASIAVQG